jgi:hypothetical protein
MKTIERILATAGLIGITSIPFVSAKEKREEYPTMKDAMEVLGVRDPSQISILGGYKAHRGDDGRIRTVAGIYAGTVVVERYGGGYRASGEYSEARYPKAMERTLREADTDGNKIVTREEVAELLRRVYPCHVGKGSSDEAGVYERIEKEVEQAKKEVEQAKKEVKQREKSNDPKGKMSDKTRMKIESDAEKAFKELDGMKNK